MAAADVSAQQNQNLVDRVTRLPLVSSACFLVWSVYVSTKDTHPYIRSVCEVAEQGVLSTMDQLEPQMSMVNHLACRGLDQIERSLPIFHQPSQQDTCVQIVSSAKDILSSMVERSRTMVQDGVDKTRTAVQESVDKTRTVVGEGVTTVLDSRVGRLVSTSMDSALSTSENLVDQCLPVSQEEELELESTFDQKQLSFYVRLGSLSARLRRRAYSRAVGTLQEGTQRGRSFICQLHAAISMIQFTQKNRADVDQLHPAEEMESLTLDLARCLTQQLQTSCLVLVSSLQGLPHHVQQEVLSLSHSIRKVYSTLGSAVILGDMRDGVLSSSRVHLKKMSRSLDHIRDYLVNNTPLNWLVGPFYPRMAPEPTPDLGQPGQPTPRQLADQTEENQLRQS